MLMTAEIGQWDIVSHTTLLTLTCEIFHKNVFK